MEKTKIEYCQSTWNPISGCKFDCDYCYARGTATRFKGCDFAPEGVTDKTVVYLTERLPVTNKDGVTRMAAYPYGFTPTFHEYRLNDPKTKGFGMNVFVCSMGDMFGNWIPEEWIVKVFDACKEAPNHRYLFLTKNPNRYIELHKKGLLPELDNFWYGSTMDNRMRDVFKSDYHNTFVSMEPILEPFPYPDSAMATMDKWVIMGAETGNRKGKVVPERSWIEEYVMFCKDRGIPVFMKDSLIPIWGEDLITEFPWKD